MDKQRLIQECRIMQKKLHEDKELKKVYSDVNFQGIIDSIYAQENYEEELEFAEKLFS